jgi:hypothetical protein
MSKITYTEDQAIELIAEKFKEIKKIIQSTELNTNEFSELEHYNPLTYFSGYIIDDTISFMGNLKSPESDVRYWYRTVYLEDVK